MADLVRRTVTSKDVGARLDVFLAGQPEIGGRGRARQCIDSKRVRVPRERVRPSLSLREGQQVEFEPDADHDSDPLAPGGTLPDVEVLYEDDWVCAINKPVGLAAHPSTSRFFREHTVASWALDRFGELPSVGDVVRPGIVHRLDRGTSGVMLLARNQIALDFLRAQFRARTVDKEYHAIVYGEPRFQSDWIERSIGVDPRHPDRMTVVSEGGREAATYYEIVERFEGFAHVRCKPKTGRTHQIRVHMTSIGHSLVGDRAYRSRVRQHDALPEGAPDPRRQCLHAMRLGLSHPQTQEPIEFEAALPADLGQLLAWLRANRSI